MAHADENELLTVLGKSLPCRRVLPTYTTLMLKNIVSLRMSKLRIMLHKCLFILTRFMGTLQPSAFNKFSLMMKTFSCSLLKIVATKRITLEMVAVAESTMFLEHVYQLLCSVSYRSMLSSKKDIYFKFWRNCDFWACITSMLTKWLVTQTNHESQSSTEVLLHYHIQIMITLGHFLCIYTNRDIFTIL